MSDDPEVVEDAPCAIQLVGKPMKDEELIRIMELVAGILKPLP